LTGPLFDGLGKLAQTLDLHPLGAVLVVAVILAFDASAVVCRTALANAVVLQGIECLMPPLENFCGENGEKSNATPVAGIAQTQFVCRCLADTKLERASPPLVPSKPPFFARRLFLP
jgi:hypothetical protein